MKNDKKFDLALSVLKELKLTKTQRHKIIELLCEKDSKVINLRSLKNKNFIIDVSGSDIKKIIARDAKINQCDFRNIKTNFKIDNSKIENFKIKTSEVKNLEIKTSDIEDINIFDIRANYLDIDWSIFKCGVSFHRNKTKYFNHLRENQGIFPDLSIGETTLKLKKEEGVNFFDKEHTYIDYVHSLRGATKEKAIDNMTYHSFMVDLDKIENGFIPLAMALHLESPTGYPSFAENAKLFVELQEYLKEVQNER